MENTSVDQAIFCIISNKRRTNIKFVRSCIITLLHREQRCNFLCNRRRDPTKDKSAQIAQPSTTLCNFWGPGPIPWDFSGPSGANETPQRGRPQESTSPRTDVPQTLDRPQKCMDLRHLRAYWPTGPAPESQS